MSNENHDRLYSMPRLLLFADCRKERRVLINDLVRRRWPALGQDRERTPNGRMSYAHGLAGTVPMPVTSATWVIIQIAERDLRDHKEKGKHNDTGRVKSADCIPSERPRELLSCHSRVTANQGL